MAPNKTQELGLIKLDHDPVAGGIVGHTESQREVSQRGVSEGVATEPGGGVWSSAVWLPCRDGKARPIEPCLEPLADGLSSDLGLVRLESYPDRPHEERLVYAPLIQKGKARVGRLRGYGNAIVPQVAAEVLRSWLATMESRDRVAMIGDHQIINHPIEWE